jgi:hypothetical protein
MFIFPVFKIILLILNLNIFYFLLCIFNLWFVQFPKETLELAQKANCTYKKFTKFIIILYN